MVPMVTAMWSQVKKVRSLAKKVLGSTRIGVVLKTATICHAPTEVGGLQRQCIMDIMYTAVTQRTQEARVKAITSPTEHIGQHRKLAAQA